MSSTIGKQGVLHIPANKLFEPLAWFWIEPFCGDTQKPPRRISENGTQLPTASARNNCPVPPPDRFAAVPGRSGPASFNEKSEVR
jgi:hypothetical protein